MHQYYFSRLSSQRIFLLQQQQQRALFLCTVALPLSSSCTAATCIRNKQRHYHLLARCCCIISHHLDGATTIQKMTRRSVQHNASAALRKNNNDKKEGQLQIQDVKVWPRDHSFESKKNGSQGDNDHVVVEASPQIKSSSSSSDTMRRLAAQCLPHWLSRRDRDVWRNRTMQHLNLLPPASTTTTPPASPILLEADEEEASALQRLSSNDLYYDSFDSFHERIQQHVGDDDDVRSKSATISNDLQHALDRLVHAGFADGDFARRYNKYEEYQVRLETLCGKILAIQNGDGELHVWQKERDKLTRQVTKEKRKYDNLQQQQESDSSCTETTTPNEESVGTQSAVQSLLTAWKRFVFPTTAATTTTSSTEPSQHDESEESKINKRLQKRAFFLSKKIHDMERRIKTIERSIASCDSHIQSAMQRLDKSTKKKHALHKTAPMTNAEYTRANQVVESVMDIVCQDLAKHIEERHSHILEQYRVLDAKTDLTKPHEWFPYARLDCRKIIFHGGPTNSGKTYAALERLKQASKGMYLGPLRLLAAEVYEQLTLAGIYCNLYTGQEQREIPFATHGAATVEMASLVDNFDIIVIDEIQMIGDSERGFAWTRALLGSRCKEIHVCGGMEALGIVRRLAHACGDDFECRQYQRFTDLKVAKKSLARSSHQKDSYRNVQPGDCVVAFSRNDIFAIKREIETTTKYKCTVIYGSLPPQTRSEQARLFNDPNSGYDILVASDAIGMGLNLNIRRIVFNSIYKHDGNGIVRLGHSAVKQISGRAGRRNSIYPNGEVTTRCPEDMEYLKKCMETEIDSVERAGLLPTANHIDAFSSALEHYGLGDRESNKLHKTLQRFSEMASVQSDFFLCRQTEMHGIARSITSFPLTIREKYTLCMCPVNTDSSGSMHVLRRFASKLAAGEVSGLTHRMVPRKPESFDDLSKLCQIFSEFDLFLWLQHKFPPGNIMEQQAALARKELTIGLVNEALANAHSLKLNHCYVSRDQLLRETMRKTRRPRPDNRDGDSRNSKKNKRTKKGRGEEWNRGVPDI